MMQDSAGIVWRLREHGTMVGRAGLSVMQDTCELAAAHIEAQAVEIAQLTEVMKHCRAQFQFYADEHTKAGKTEKAATNQQFADACRAALNGAKP